MAGRSPETESSSDSDSSESSSPQSSYLSAPRYQSSARHGSRSGTAPSTLLQTQSSSGMWISNKCSGSTGPGNSRIQLILPARHPREMMRSRLTYTFTGYVSPYPLLSTAHTSSAGLPITASTHLRASQRSAQSSSSSATSTDEQRQVREDDYTSPSSPMFPLRRHQISSPVTMLGHPSSITQVGRRSAHPSFVSRTSISTSLSPPCHLPVLY